MDNIRHTHPASSPGRRAFLGFTVAGLAVPLGAMAPASWRMGRSIIARCAGPFPHLPCGSRGHCRRSRRHAARTEDLLEREFGLQRGHCGRRPARLLRPAQSQGREDQFCGRNGSVAGAARQRQGGRRRRHGAGLAEAAGAGLRREADGGASWRLHPPAHQPAVRYHQRCRVEGQGGRDGQHGGPGQEFHIDPGGQAAASIR